MTWLGAPVQHHSGGKHPCSQEKRRVPIESSPPWEALGIDLRPSNRSIPTRLPRVKTANRQPSAAACFIHKQALKTEREGANTCLKFVVLCRGQCSLQ